MPAANEREDTFNEETRLRRLGGGDQRVRSSLLVCVTKRIKHLAIRGNLKIISGGGGQLKLSFRTNIGIIMRMNGQRFIQMSTGVKIKCSFILISSCPQ